MKKALTLLLIFVCSKSMFAQVTSADYAVPLTATTSLVTPTITLYWPYSDSATSYKVYRKLKDATGWGSVRATLTISDTSYADTNVSVDTAYEYRVVKAAYNTTEEGYIFSAIRLPAYHDKGILILL